MIPEAYAEFGLLLLFLLMMGALLYMIERQGLLKRWLQAPKKFPITAVHKKELNKILELIPKLNVNEREVVAQQLISGPIKVLKGRSNNREWLEGFYYDEHLDVNLTYTKSKEDKYFG